MSELDETMNLLGARELLRVLRNRGALISLVGDRIQVSAPTGVVTPDFQTAIRGNRDEIIALLTSEATPNVPVRLSPGQSRLWLFQQLEPASATYNLTPAIRIEGPLDQDRLERALAAVLERHEPLRSVVDDSDPLGLIRPLPAPEKLLSVVDLSGLPPEARRGAAIERTLADQREPFDLIRDIPLRATLLRFGPEEHQLVTTFHHIGVDGTSLQHFYRDLITFYDGQTPPPLRASYREFAAWEHGYWNPGRRAERTAYWRRTMEGVPPALELPVDVPRKDAQAFKGGLVGHVVDGADHDAIRGLMREEGASLFMVMLAAFAAALHAQSGQRDMVIGTPLHGRDRPEFSDLVGMFVNQLPLRVRVPRETTFRQLVRDARAIAIGTMTEHELPFGEIVEAAGVPRDASRNPLFQVLLNVLPLTRLETGLRAGEVNFVLPEVHEMMPLFDGQSRFDITLYVTQRPGEFHFHLVYNSDIFLPERGQSLITSLAKVLSAASPDVPLATVLAPPTRIMPRTATPEIGGTVVDRIREIANGTPDGTAIHDGTRALTWAELVSESNRIARLVADASPSRRRPIGVMVPHDHQIATGILGVLSSGRPYVPLDPEYPRARLELMIEDSGLSAILTTRELHDRATALASPALRVLTTDDDPPPAAPLPTPPRPDDLAYLLYTSGSTGTPKAVRQSHRNLFVQSHRYTDTLTISPRDRVALVASISFDASLMDLFGGLLGGACVYPIDAYGTDLSLLPEIVRDAGLTILHVTPTVFRTLGRITEGQDWSPIRAVTLGGEPVRLEDIVFFDRAFPADAGLLNLYGSSEHSFSVGEFVDRNHRGIEVPIGVPLGDVEVGLIDGEGRPDPVIGEMVIRSAYSVLGYHGQFDRTATTFTADTTHPGRTCYRTGDLARRRPDGRLVALGRVDGQVKIRGHRVELAEVESVLRKHPAVLDAGVHAPVGADGERWLIGCWVVRPDMEVTAEDLSIWCARELPRYMVPGGWVRVSSLPRTPSGKIDRKKLPAPRLDGGSGEGFTSPTSPAEIALAGIWSEVLNCREPAREDSFFELGGNSLLAVQILAVTRDRLGVTLPLRTIFDAPRLADQAALLAEILDPSPAEPSAVLPKEEEFVDV